MQFLWKYVDEMVGKGLEMSVLGEMFFYTALSFVPMALPLAILLASLMTFGNLGEQFELLAMKAAGISLLRIMKPMIIFLLFVVVGVFYFQNNVIPLSQVKMWTLLHSMKQKSPELEIAEKTFNNEIEGYNLYVTKKDKTGLLIDLMIYDYSGGFNNATVTVADSGRLKMATDKLHIIFTLHNGETFENMPMKDKNRSMSNAAVRYRTETFKTKDVLIPFDANFTRQDESSMRDRYVGKNLAALQQSIDSMSVRLDSINQLNATQLYNSSYRKSFGYSDNTSREPVEEEKQKEALDFDKLFQEKSANVRLSLLNQVKSVLTSTQSDYSFRDLSSTYEEKELRRHYAEKHTKFALSFACLIFFFIGAPLGAIIRKGGLGMPVVISVLLFIFYYVINNIGTKMAVNGIWQPWQGMWLSSAVLLPMGVFLTYKATNDSVIFNADTYIDVFKKLIGKRITRNIEKKELILFNLDYTEFARRISELNELSATFLEKSKRRMPYFAFWKQGGRDRDTEMLSIELEKLVEEGNNSEQNLVLNKLMDYPVLNRYRMVNFAISETAGLLIACLLPVGLFIYGVDFYRRKMLLQDVRTIQQVNGELLSIIDKEL
jgi:lipopolysaccharide export system permease protein